MFERFDENPAMTLQDIKRKMLRMDACTDGWTHAQTDGQRENSIPTTNFHPPQTKFAGGIKTKFAGGIINFF